MTAGAIILSSRAIFSERQFDPMALLGSCSVLQRLVRTLQSCGIRQILLLTTPQKRAELEKHMSHWGTLCLEMPEDAAPLRMLQEGLHTLGPSCDRVLFLAADIPFLSRATVRTLLNAAGPLGRPAVRGQDGGVLSISSDLFPYLESADPTRSLDMVLGENGFSFQRFPVQDEGILPEAQAMGLFPALLAQSREHDVHVSLKLRLCRDRPFFGPGTAQLLSLIDSTGSVREACLQMGLSYSKGRHMIAVMEEELGISIVLRQQGGRNGGVASLTPEGRQLIVRFQQFDLRCQELVQAVYEEVFS